MTRRPMPRAGSRRGVLARLTLVVLVALVARANANSLNAEALYESNVLSAAAAPVGGFDHAGWYANGAWREDWYERALGTSTGKTVTVNDAVGLMKALRDPVVEFVLVNATARLDELAAGSSPDAWPEAGVTITRRITLRGVCETHSSERCALTAGLRSVMNVVDGGRATVERLTVTGAQSDDFGGAFYFGRGHGGGRFENVAFVACLAERAGGAVYVSNDANAGNVAFVGVNFTSNRVVAASSRGGAVYVSTEGASRVTFDKCLFDGNDASGGFGGGLYAHGGRVVVNECNFTGNFAKTGGGASFRSGGVVSSSIFVDNNATQDVGGGLHITSATDIVDGAYACAIQRSLFRNNRAVRAGGGLFAYGRARMLANEFSSNALTGAVNVPAYANLNDYYACTDMSSTGCTLFPTLAADVYDANPDAFDPFTPQSVFASIPSS